MDNPVQRLSKDPLRKETCSVQVVGHEQPEEKKENNGSPGNIPSEETGMKRLVEERKSINSKNHKGEKPEGIDGVKEKPTETEEA